MNKIVITGRLTRDPQTRQSNSGLTVTNISVAVDRPTAKGQEKATDFIDCVAFRKTAEFISKWFVKGKPILVVGRLQSRDWVDKEGSKRRSWEVIVDEAEFFGGEKTEKKQEAEVPANIKPGEFAPLPNDGDLPFDMNDGSIDDLPL